MYIESKLSICRIVKEATMNADTGVINLSFDQDEKAQYTPLLQLDQCIVTIDEHDGSDQTRFDSPLSSKCSKIDGQVSQLPNAIEVAKSSFVTDDTQQLRKSNEASGSSDGSERMAKGSQLPDSRIAAGSSTGLECTVQGPPLPNKGRESGNDLGIATRLQPLPSDKKHHLFISYSSDDIDEVMKIVDQLEQRFDLCCIFAARDFQAGKQVIENIQDSMDKSLKNVLMLTPNFLKSSFCKFERDIAFKASIESGVNSIIPVLLQACDIPKSLATVTHIDGTLPGVDIPAEIAKALIQNELVCQSLMTDHSGVSNKYENGRSVSIKALKKKETSCRFKAAEYAFSLSENDLSQLSLAKLNIPKESIHEAFNVLNQHNLFEPFEDSLRTLRQFGSGYFIWGILAIICLVLFFIRDEVPLKITSVVISVGTFIALLTLAKLRRRYFIQSLQIDQDVRMKVWRQLRDICTENNIIVFFDRRWNAAPTFNIMRYDISKCEMFLAAQLRSRGHSTESDSPEILAAKQIQDAIDRLLPYLTYNLCNLPDAPNTRHAVWKSKMCLCQMIETDIYLDQDAKLPSMRHVDAINQQCCLC